ncbi:hypothetical protein FB45DRAFT_266961 [Roridomyces roridus]|uniref:Uncharacterized protein n=1 Tax=Roridomyces roridus TaxID=1738132 RepID=A0AAD7FDB3_9AGAR|nr:hypothetical protein FB45DRAFT_266961 [Roridomyces roridus]
MGKNKKYHCQCSKCSKLTYVDVNGVTAPGQLISSGQLYIHGQKDNTNQLLAQAGFLPETHPEPLASEVDDPLKVAIPAFEVFQAALAPITMLCVTLAAWLNLHVGVSRENSSIFLKALGFILSTAITSIFSVLRFTGAKLETPSLNIPKDIRTVYQHGLEPQIIQTACCPVCYKPYPVDPTKPEEKIPDICDWRKSPRSHACGAVLVKQVRNPNGTVQRLPVFTYCTQSFESWLQFFLSRPQVDQELDRSFQKQQARQNMPQPKVMRDVQDSPAWNGLRHFLASKYHLVFSFYIDWFNPLTNKIAGPVVSCGAIVLYCLNLPVESRFLLENIFIFSLIPGPGEPDVWTIAHVLIAFTKMMNEFGPPGKIIPTRQNPLGVQVAVRILPLIADLQAIRKVAGYMAFNATQFCT